MKGSKINGWVTALDWTLGGVTLNREVVTSYKYDFTSFDARMAGPSPSAIKISTEMCDSPFATNTLGGRRAGAA